MAEKYDILEALPDTELNGVPVRHYRAVRTHTDQLTTETAEVWVGMNDGRPRQAVIQMREPFSPERLLAPLLENARRGFEDPGTPYYRYKDLPVVTRGVFPSEKVVTWTYTFDAFNRPVEIVPPMVGR